QAGPTGMSEQTDQTKPFSTFGLAATETGELEREAGAPPESVADEELPGEPEDADDGPQEVPPPAPEAPSSSVPAAPRPPVPPPIPPRPEPRTDDRPPPKPSQDDRPPAQPAQ